MGKTGVQLWTFFSSNPKSTPRKMAKEDDEEEEDQWRAQEGRLKRGRRNLRGWGRWEGTREKSDILTSATNGETDSDPRLKMEWDINHRNQIRSIVSCPHPLRRLPLFGHIYCAILKKSTCLDIRVEELVLNAYPERIGSTLRGRDTWKEHFWNVGRV